MRLSVAFPRKSDGKLVARALASLEGAAGEALPMLSVNADRVAIEDACKTYGVSADLFSRRAIVSHPMDDVPASYGGLLPEKNAKGAKICFGRLMTSNLSLLANNLLAQAQGDYVLFMSPGEVCLDPLNITNALNHLDTQPQIDVVSCPVKIYSNGEHVRTIMVPKIFRRLGKAAFTGVLMDNWEPCNDVNWLLSASGLTFQDHGDAWPDPSAADLFDLKLLLHDLQGKPWPDDDVGRAKMVAAWTKVGQLLPKWNAFAALDILNGVTVKHPAKTADIVPALVARGRIFWRHMEELRLDRALDLAMESLDSAIGILPTAAAHLERGFLKHGWDDSWRRDLERGIAIARETTTYGLDMRELRLAALALDTRPAADPKRCQETARKRGGAEAQKRDEDEQCLQDANGHRTHEALDCGERLIWCDP